MKENKVLIFIVGILLVSLLISCATVNVNIIFPAEQLQEAADNIVQEISGNHKDKKQETNNKKDKDKKNSFLTSYLFKEALADVNLTLSTPKIERLKAELKKEYSRLKKYKSKGVIGENREGLIEIVTTEGLSSKEIKNLKKFVKKVNNNRLDLYKELAKANNLPLKYLKKVQELFANSWYKMTDEEEWVKTKEGKWIRKKEYKQ